MLAAAPAPADRRARRRDAQRAKILGHAWCWPTATAWPRSRCASRGSGRARQPSLYTYFDSKLAIYDAMFAAGNEVLLDRLVRLPPEPDVQQQLVAVARTFVQFSTDDPVRYQLLFQRTIPGFEPSPQSYALAQRVYEHSREQLAAAGGTLPADMDMWTALIAGLADQQVANDPGANAGCC